MCGSVFSTRPLYPRSTGFCVIWYRNSSSSTPASDFFLERIFNLMKCPLRDFINRKKCRKNTYENFASNLRQSHKYQPGLKIFSGTPLATLHPWAISLASCRIFPARGRGKNNALVIWKPASTATIVRSPCPLTFNPVATTEVTLC